MFDFMKMTDCRWSEIEDAMRTLFDGGRHALEARGGKNVMAGFMATLADEELAYLVYSYFVAIVNNTVSDDNNGCDDECDGYDEDCEGGPDGEYGECDGDCDNCLICFDDDEDIVFDMGTYVIRANKQSFSIEPREGFEVVGNECRKFDPGCRDDEE